MSRDWCETCVGPVRDCPFNGQHPESAITVASSQVAASMAELDRHADTYVRWPWPSLDALYGGMAPGTLHYVVGFSGIGKSTFIASAIAKWADAGRKVHVMPLEVRPDMFRTYMACQSLSIDPGLVMSGDYKRRPDAADIQAKVEAALLAQCKEPFLSRVTVHGVPDVSVGALTQAVTHATEQQGEILVIDHVDHLEGAAKGRSLYESSVEVNRAALKLAQRSELVIVAMSQANQGALANSQDHLAKYQPLKDNHVLNGGHKRQIAHGMLGLYRPVLDAPEGGTEADYEAWKETISLARRGEREPGTALEPMTMGVNLMKSRTYGSREGQRIALAWSNGRVVEKSVLPRSLRVVRP